MVGGRAGCDECGAVSPSRLLCRSSETSAASRRITEGKWNEGTWASGKWDDDVVDT